MNEVLSVPTPDISYPVDYQVFAGHAYNLDLKGSGTLTIRQGGAAYLFTGKRRALFSSGRTDLEFTPSALRNVIVDGRSIRFDTSLGESGRKQTPFIFFCQTAEEARLVATLLPGHQDADFSATQDFTQKLHELAGARSPWTSVTNIIIGLNGLMFVIMGCLGAGWFDVASMTPYILYAANNGAATTDGEWWRLLTSMFTHYGAIHLLLNMWALFQAGHFLEKVMGRRLYALTYLGSGLAGGLLSIAWHRDQIWSAGASGAVFGVYGAILGYMLRQKKALPAGVYQSMMKSSLTFAGYNIVYGMARTGIDNAAHLGGITGGFVLGWLLALPVDRDMRAQHTGRRLQLGLTAIGVMLVLGIALTPRFDYRVRDVMAWETANEGLPEMETSLMQEHQKYFEQLFAGKNDPAYADWLETTLIPFYEKWATTVSGLNLSPDKSTARVRTALLAIFAKKVASYHHLATGISARDKAAVKHYEAEDREVAEDIGRMQALWKQ